MNIKKISRIFMLAICLSLSYLAEGHANPLPEQKLPEVKASAACLMDTATGLIYYEKEGDKRREPASLTKVMTAILAIENGNLKDVVTVSKKAAVISMGQDIGLQTGDRLYLEDLLKAALMHSANDSTVAIAEHIGGSHDMFVKMMNDKARALGMLHTHFANTNGFHHPDHYTTAKDLAILASYALKNKTFAELVKTQEATITWLPNRDELKTGGAADRLPVRRLVLHNTNRLLQSDFKGIDGVKTGTTPRAGNCLIASATREGRQLVAVILHSSNRWSDAIKLLTYGFTEVKPVVLAEKDEVMAELPVIGGTDKKVTLVAAQKVEAYLVASDTEKVVRRITLAPAPAAPVKQGSKLGTATYYLNGREIAAVDLVANRRVDRLSWFKRWFS
ncbi:D-alanyl-D-alanine carboxypeptidase family protein [Desulforamulus hydrothermalis]|uniref:serine-type D-Ala-D-Ala carboxypeptidase n=1 Tax=Desulforamulus hydrothermalis Lam5 = DSM 18033 TaxID=1121428 RepID=K8EEV3_9FIRM|nr:D-alanyl-D-alanine carboxypeptidase family protein [Desulforamulus hydrothermalis]CCO07276.1 Serine-type D-Ala-D-Ala carboxypeptidase [Desulforamulus hydrothermalis Lam5 = DSM 18033]